MPFLLAYIIKVSISLGIVFLFYQFLLRRLTFYNLNRWYLLGYTFLSFFISLINISPLLERNKWEESQVVQWIPAIHTTDISGNIQTIQAAGSSHGNWIFLGYILLVGMMLMAFRLLSQLYSFRRMKRMARLIPGTGTKLYQVNELIIPFSFGNSIFINQQLHTDAELEEIIRHEFVHVKQKHTTDIIWGEVLCLLNWFNPFAWLLKAAIRQNLEFIADNKVVENGFNKKQYQYLLLKVIGNNQYSIASKFNFSSLKKRIAMMNKLKSAKVHALRFLFVLPLLSALLLAFRGNQAEKSKARRASVSSSNTPGITVASAGKTSIYVAQELKETLDTVPPVNTLNSKGYLIDLKGKKANCVVVVKDKDGKEIKKVLLTDWNKKEDFYTSLYGEILPPPPPPKPVVSEPPPPPPIPVITAPEKSNDEGVKRISYEFDISDKKAYIKLKDGTTEEYDFTKPGEKADFEKKYGKVITIADLKATIATPVITTTINSTTPVAVTTATTITPVVINSVAATVPVVTKSVTTTSPTVNTVSGHPISTSTKAITIINSNDAATVVSPVTVTGENVIVADEYGDPVIGKEDILIKITRTTTPKELEEFKKQMSEKGIDLTFDETKYNDKGILTRIAGHMKLKDRHSEFNASDFKTITLAAIKNGNRTYLKVSIVDNKKIVI